MASGRGVAIGPVLARADVVLEYPEERRLLLVRQGVLFFQKIEDGLFLNLRLEPADIFDELVDRRAVRRFFFHLLDHRPSFILHPRLNVPDFGIKGKLDIPDALLLLSAQA